MNVTISSRIAEFVRQYPPFRKLPVEELNALAQQVEVRHFAAEERIFSEGEEPEPFFFMVHKGYVALYRESPERRELVDHCDDGDIFGILPLFANDRHRLTAVAAEETLLYAFPQEVARETLKRHPEIGVYFASVFASTLSQRDASAEGVATKASLERPPDDDSPDTTVHLMGVVPSREVVSCPPDITIRAAALRMNQEGVGSILVTNNAGHPLGIVTDTDLRRKVTAAETDVREHPVSSIMSAPVVTTSPEQTVAESTLLMVKHHIHHLCITQNGTAESRALGIISDHDVLLSRGDHPAALVTEMLKAGSVEALSTLRDKAAGLIQQYLSQDVAIDFVASIATEVNDALIRRILELKQTELAAEGQAAPDVPFCFMSLGSEGRKEQLLRTDQDNALVFDPAGASTDPTPYFLELSRRVTHALNECGFEFCPADMMASNPKWCRPLADWKAYFADWVGNPDLKNLLRSNIFFDFRPVYGATHLADALREHVYVSMENTRGFLPFLAKNALLNPPPLSFFRNFVVEKDGDHRNKFDIKARAMMPLTDAGRVLAYELRLPGYLSTRERFRATAAADPTLAERCQEAAEAYGVLMRFRAETGLSRQTSGRYVDPESLGKLDRQQLRSVFGIIERVQNTLRLRYQLDYIRA